MVVVGLAVVVVVRSSAIATVRICARSANATGVVDATGTVEPTGNACAPVRAPA